MNSNLIIHRNVPRIFIVQFINYINSPPVIRQAIKRVYLAVSQASLLFQCFFKEANATNHGFYYCVPVPFLPAGCLSPVMVQSPHFIPQQVWLS